MSPCQWRNSMSRCHRAHAALGAQETTHTQLGGTGDIPGAGMLQKYLGYLGWVVWQTAAPSREGQLTPSPCSHRGKRKPNGG